MRGNPQSPVKAATISPVSYTHLDVYKRQVEVEELANTERDVREQTRASRIRFIAAIAGIALLAILAIWMLL